MGGRSIPTFKLVLISWPLRSSSPSIGPNYAGKNPGIKNITYPMRLRTSSAVNRWTSYQPQYYSVMVKGLSLTLPKFTRENLSLCHTFGIENRCIPSYNRGGGLSNISLSTVTMSATYSGSTLPLRILEKVEACFQPFIIVRQPNANLH